MQVQFSNKLKLAYVSGAELYVAMDAKQVAADWAKNYSERASVNQQTMGAQIQQMASASDFAVVNVDATKEQAKAAWAGMGFTLLNMR